MIPLEHMLAPFGLDPTAQGSRVGIVRHRDQTLNVSDIYRAGHLELYQSFQARAVFRKYDSLLTFVGLPDLEAVFVGVSVPDHLRPGTASRDPKRHQSAMPRGSRIDVSATSAAAYITLLSAARS